MDGAVRPAGGGWRVGLRCGPAAIDAGGDEPDDGAWLAAFLGPWCDTMDPERASLRVRLLRSDGLMERLERGMAGQATAPVPCFGLDSRTIALPGWSEGGRLWLYDDKAESFLGIEGRSVDIVSRAGGRAVWLALGRVVRELIAGGVRAAEPVVDLHAASFSVAGKAVLLAGPKKAGKTSLLCHALLSGGAALLGNDRAFVQVDGAGPVVRGVPTVVSIRSGTRMFFPQLQRHRRPRGDSLDSDTDSGTGTDSGAGPADLRLIPAEFTGWVGCAHVREAPLHAIVMPERHAALDGWALERLSGEEALARLDPCRYGAACAHGAPTVLAALASAVAVGGGAVRRGPAAGGAPQSLLRWLAADFPVYRFRIGPSLYGEPASRWLRALGLEGAAA